MKGRLDSNDVRTIFSLLYCTIIKDPVGSIIIAIFTRSDKLKLMAVVSAIHIF